MKWIKFNDMKPPVGMYVFVTTRGDISILRWEKSYEKWDSEFVTVYSNDWPQPREIYALDFWCPVSFIDQHLPQVSEQDDLDPELNWYIQNKDNPNFQKILDIKKDLESKSKEELDKWVTVGASSSSYSRAKLTEIVNLFEEVCYPGRKEAELKAMHDNIANFWSSVDISFKK